MKVTNNSPGVQGVQTGSGCVYLKPGQSRDLSLSPDAEARIRRLPFIKVEADVVAPVPSLESSSDSDPGDEQEASGGAPADDKLTLIADLAALGIKADRRWSVAKLTDAMAEALK